MDKYLRMAFNVFGMNQIWRTQNSPKLLLLNFNEQPVAISWLPPSLFTLTLKKIAIIFSALV